MSFEHTKPHVETNNFNRYTVRTGKNLPDGAVNLIYYHNRPLIPIECLLVSNSARLFNDYMSIKHTEYKSDLTKKEESAFKQFYHYFDQYGYDGMLKLRKIDWFEKVHGDTKPTNYKETITIPTPLAPNEKEILTDDGYKGTLYLTDVQYSIKSSSQIDVYGKKIKTYNVKVIKNNLYNKDNNVFPTYYPIVDFPYAGQLPLDRVDAWVPVYSKYKYDILTKKIYVANKNEAENLIEVNDNYGKKVVIPLIDVRNINTDMFDCKNLGIICDDVYINKDKMDFTKLFPDSIDADLTLDDGTKLTVHGTYDSFKVEDIGKKKVLDWGFMVYTGNSVNETEDYYEIDSSGKVIKGKWNDSYPKDSSYFYDQAGNPTSTFSLSGWSLNTARNTSSGGASAAEWLQKINFIPPENSYTRDAIDYLKKLNFNKSDITSKFGIKDTYFNNAKDIFSCFLMTKYSSNFIWDKTNFTKLIGDFSLNLNVDTQTINFQSADLSNTVSKIEQIFSWLGDSPHTFVDTRDSSTGFYRDVDGGPELAKGEIWAVYDKGIWKYDHYVQTYTTEWWPKVSADQRTKLKDWRPEFVGKSYTDPNLNIFNDSTPKAAKLEYIKHYDDGMYEGDVSVNWFQDVYLKPQPYNPQQGTVWNPATATNYRWEVVGNLIKKENRYFRPAVLYYEREISQQIVYPVYKYDIYEAVYSGMSTPYNNAVKCYTGVTYYTGALDRSEIIDKKITPIDWKADCIYSGVVNKSWFTYDGYARYEGIALKANDISNMNPDGSDIVRMYCDDTGTLFDERGFSQLNSDNFIITDKFSDETPLFYVYKLNSTIYNKVGPDVRGILQDNSVTIVDRNNYKIDTTRFKYSVILKRYKPTDPNYEHIYEVYLYTNFVNTFSNPLYCIYNAYDNSTEKITPTFKEQISLIPVNKTTVDINKTITSSNGVSTIVINNPSIISDTRGKIKIKYRIETTDFNDTDVNNIKGYASNWYDANIVNVKYAFPNELDIYKGSMQNISPSENGVQLNALDLIKRDCVKRLTVPGSSVDELDGNKIKELEKKTFVVKLNISDSDTNTNKSKVIYYTDPNGLSYIYAETTEDTGFLNKITKEYTEHIALPYIYTTKNDKIYPGYCIKCKDAIEVKVDYPREKYTLEDWYPVIAAGHFNKAVSMYGIKTNSVYKVPEYNNQEWSGVYGKPYIDISNERAEIINTSTIKLRYTPVHLDYDYTLNKIKNIKIKRTDTIGNVSYLNVKNYYCYEGIIEVDAKINLNDIIDVDYTYEELNLTYRGYYDENDSFIDLDLNPFKHHTYKDTEAPYERQNTYHLFDKTIYFFIRPYYIANEENTSKIVDNTNLKSLIYHRINEDKPYDENDIAIGQIYIKHNSSLKDCTIVDTRVRGGGVIEDMLDKIRQELEPESDYYWDIGYFDGEPYNENGVVIIRLDKRILRKYGGVFSEEDVQFVINKYIATGVLPVVEYIDIFEEESTPQNTLIVESKFTNTTDNVPFVLVHVENDFMPFYDIIVEDQKLNRPTRVLGTVVNRFTTTTMIEVI